MRKNYGFIDSFRGLAILLVLLTHFIYIYRPENIHLKPGILRFLDFGARGVQLFYMVSAFTLFNSYFLRMQEDGNITVRFYIRRIFRIAPLFYLCLVLMILNIQFHFFENWQFFTDHFLKDIKTYEVTDIKLWYFTTFIFTNGLFPKYLQSPYPGGWSIAVEFTFYMMIPLLVKLIKDFSTSVKITVISLCVGFLVELFVVVRPQSIIINNFFYFSIFRQFYFFALGITAFYFLKEKTIDYSNRLYYHILIFITSFFIISSSSSILLTGLLFFFLVLLNSDSKTTILNNPIMQHIGKISFSIYLTQWWVIVFLSKLEFIGRLNMVLVFIIFVACNVILSSLTYYLIEKRFVRLGEIVAKKYF
jgi:peptidoglycan/LPS O-acetylase OafA/YrhL